MCNNKSVEIGHGVLDQGNLFREFNLKKKNYTLINISMYIPNNILIIHLPIKIIWVPIEYSNILIIIRVPYQLCCSTKLINTYVYKTKILYFVPSIKIDYLFIVYYYVNVAWFEHNITTQPPSHLVLIFIPILILKCACNVQ